MPMINLKSLCSLRILHLEYCFSYGNINEVIKRLPRCSPNKLQELHLQSNNLTGYLPSVMGYLTSIVILDLSWNNITGLLQTFIGKFSSLQTLDLTGNNFTGGVPYEIGVLTNLTNLYLGNNAFNIVIKQKHFGGLKSLKYLELAYTSLKIEVRPEWQPPFRLYYADFATCHLGPLFPAWLCWMADIDFLDISGTGIKDKIPHWFSDAFSNSVYLNLARNEITGYLPRNMEIKPLQRLYLNSNNLTGPIPLLPPNVTYLDISLNSLCLFSNRITGAVPEYICKCKELTVLDLANNLFEGPLPPCSGLTKLMTVELSNNSLSGEFPSFLQNSTNLQFLDLAWNKFTGRLPPWIGNLVGLQFLRLKHNMFSGNIPMTITNLGCLQYLDVAENGIYGKYYSNENEPFSNQMSIRVLVCPDTKGQELNYGSSSHFLDKNVMSIDISSNNLSGKIPEEIVTLDALVNLNLSRNHFSRTVPDDIGVMKSLQSLDLSRNRLSGGIPASMSDMTFLSYLDLSYNNLTGIIPPGSQLDSIYASNPYMYAGNIGLCGPPLIKNCSSSNVSLQSDFKGSEGGPEFFYLGLGCGFIVGIWM
ncbi:hypothetical protein U9M48_002318, partial [Paspalum notatum var. saurae]